MLDARTLLKLFPGDRSQLDMSAPLLDQGVDSLSLVEWMYRIEEECGVILDDDRLLELANEPLQVVVDDFVAQLSCDQL